MSARRGVRNGPLECARARGFPVFGRRGTPGDVEVLAHEYGLCGCGARSVAGVLGHLEGGEDSAVQALEGHDLGVLGLVDGPCPQLRVMHIGQQREDGGEGVLTGGIGRTRWLWFWWADSVSTYSW